MIDENRLEEFVCPTVEEGMDECIRRIKAVKEPRAVVTFVHDGEKLYCTFAGPPSFAIAVAEAGLEHLTAIILKRLSETIQ